MFQKLILCFILFFLMPLIQCRVLVRDNNKYTYVFIHGAMHGAWCFDAKLIPYFKENDIKTVTFDLPGCGDDFTPPGKVTLQSHIDKTLSVINKEVNKNEKIILVAHSLGGLTATLVAERIPERLHSVVYLAAWFLKDGQALVDMPIKNHMYTSKDTSSLMIMDDQYIKHDFYNDCTSEDVEYAKTRIRDQPNGVTTEKMKVKGTIYSLKKYYINTLQDNAIQPALQETMYKEGNFTHVFKVDTSHSPFMSQPKQIYDILTKIKTMN